MILTSPRSCVRRLLPVAALAAVLAGGIGVAGQQQPTASVHLADPGASCAICWD